jgi:hypothetical protein
MDCMASLQSHFMPKGTVFSFMPHGPNTLNDANPVPPHARQPGLMLRNRLSSARADSLRLSRQRGFPFGLGIYIGRISRSSHASIFFSVRTISSPILILVFVLSISVKRVRVRPHLLSL